MISLRSLILAVLYLLVASGSAFVPSGSATIRQLISTPRCRSQIGVDGYSRRRNLSLLQQSKTSESNFKEDEIQEMKDMILSLSLEPTDESRRDRLQSIFQEELAKPNGAPRYFASLFDYALVIVGDRIKKEAQEIVQKLQEEDAQPDMDEEDNEEEQPPRAFPQQQQLWALVDMMVQSKTIVKQASGDLGNKGTFQ